MLLYKQLKYSSEQLKKLAKEREAIWPPPISFSLMGKFTLPATGSSEKDNKDSTKYVKFDVPLVNTDPTSAKYERKVKYSKTVRCSYGLIPCITDGHFDALRLYNYN
jgi:hypothetical protein